MENREARRARRHLQRAQELLGFGMTGSKLNFGTGVDENSDVGIEKLSQDVMDVIFSNLSNDELLGKILQGGNHYLRKGGFEYLKSEAKKNSQRLMDAVEMINKPMIKILLDCGFSSTQDTKILVRAIQKGDEQVVKLLIESGENKEVDALRSHSVLVDAVDRIFWAPNARGTYEIVRLLIEKNVADVNTIYYGDNHVFNDLLSLITYQPTNSAIIYQPELQYRAEEVKLLELFLKKGAQYDGDDHDLNILLREWEKTSPEYCTTVTEMIKNRNRPSGEGL